MPNDNFSIVNKADFYVYLCRLDEGGRGKSSWEKYDANIFFKDFLEHVTRVEIEESLDCYFRTGKVFIHDRESVMAYFPLTGSEIISIRYNNKIEKISKKSISKTLHFSILNIEEVLDTSGGHDEGARLIVLNLVEAPLFHTFTQNTRYKTYEIDGGDSPIRNLEERKHPKRSLTLDTILKDMLEEDDILKEWYEDIMIEPTLCGDNYKLNFSIPNWTVSKTLNYLKKFTLSKEGCYPYYVFCTYPSVKEGTKPLMHFKPLGKFFKEKSYHTFSQNFSLNLSRPPQESGKNESTTSIFSFKDNDPMNFFTNYTINIFNAIQGIFSGLSGETFSTFDYIEDNKYVGTDFNNFITNHKGLGDFSLHAFDYGNQWSSIRKHSFNEPERLLAMKKNEFAKRQLQSAISCVLQGPVNHTRRIGEMADIIFRSPLGDIENPEYFTDQIFSGRWLIWAQKDIMSGNRAYSICHLVREGYSQDVASSKVNFDDISNKFSKNLHPKEA